NTGEEPYKFQKCGKSFCRSANLIQHQKIHSGEVTLHYKCPKCGKRFRSSSNLLRHQWTHTGQKLYECPECGKSF
ncbi:ZSCA2 protein, partial [Formicarius rufipectus]|nr:ZSCA2 protein [Formicarius rufipectus]